ncbi:MAG: hypothetical protein ACR2GA_03530 [Chloroflexota bacterium]
MRRGDPRSPAAANYREKEETAARRYEACLREPDVAARTAEALREACRRHGLVVGGRQLCAVLRPRFLSAERTEHLARVSAILAALLERAGAHLLASHRLLDLIGATEEERDIWSIDPGYPGFTLTSRLDSFMAHDQPRFVEYNAESPAGIGFCDRLIEVFNELPVTHAWRPDAPPQPADGRRALLEILLAAYRDWGGQDTPTMAIIDWENVITRRDFELCAELFREHGVPVTITDPRSLRYVNGTVWCGNERITLVYRRVLLPELLAKSAEIQPLLQAYRDGAICMVNSPRSKLLHKKTVFALLCDRQLGLEMTPAERAVVEQTVPWTRALLEGSTEYAGQSVDLVHLLLSQPEQFALKPTDDYGGRGVVLGWDSSPEVWAEAVEQGIVTGGFIVQERVDVPQELYPVWRDGWLQEETLLLDTNPLLFGGRMGCVLTRLSGSALLNVSAGAGSAVPTFVLQEERG